MVRSLNNSGFSLVEVLAAMGIFGIILVVTFPLTLNMGRSQEGNVQRLVAQLTAESIADLVGSLDAAGLQAALDAGKMHPCVAGGPIRRCTTGLDSDTPSAPGWLRLWAERGGNARIQLRFSAFDSAGALQNWATVSANINNFDHEIQVTITFQRNNRPLTEDVSWTKRIANL